MSALDDQTIERLTNTFTIELDDATVERHIAAIESELLAPVLPAAHGVSRWRLRIVVITAVALAVIPGLALAADTALPGDFLYPVKRLAEPVMELLRDDVAANNRVEELDRLTQRPSTGDEISDAIDNASNAVSDLPADHPLRKRLDRIADRASSTGASSEPTPDVPSATKGDRDPAGESGSEPERPAVTTTPHDDDRRDQRPTTTADSADRSSTTSARQTDRDDSQDVGAGSRDR